jgi:hypothetical protein
MEIAPFGQDVIPPAAGKDKGQVMTYIHALAREILKKNQMDWFLSKFGKCIV